MLSKSKGQTLRITTAVHVLFNWESPAIAAQRFVQLCVKHACFLAGWKDIKEETDFISDEGKEP